MMPMTFAYCCMLGLYYIAESYLFCCEKGGHATLALGVGLLVNLAGNALLIPELGLLGAVISTLLGNTVALLILLGMGRRYGWGPGRAVFVCCLLPLSLCLGPLPGLTACGLVLCWAGEAWGLRARSVSLSWVLSKRCWRKSAIQLNPANLLCCGSLSTALVNPLK